MDDWARFIAPHLSRNIPGTPDIVVQNMPGAGTTIAANHIYNIASPDGLTIGLVNPSIYMDQLLGGGATPGHSIAAIARRASPRLDRF